MDLNGEPTQNPPGTGQTAPPTGALGTITIPVPPPQAPAERTFTASEVEAFRAQERDKLHGRLTQQGDTLKTVQDELAALKAEREREAAAAEAARAQVEAEAAAAARAAEEAELSAKELLKQESARWEQQFAEMQQQQETERALWEKDREVSELRTYAQAQVAAHQDDIAPELLDLIGGNSREEIDASIVRMTEKTSAILEGIAGAQVPRPALRGTAPTGRPNIGPLDNNSTQRTLTPQQIRDMSPAEFAANRSALLAAASNHVRSNGLYG